LILKFFRWGYTQNDYWDWPQSALWIGPTLEGMDKGAGSKGRTDDSLPHAVSYFEEQKGWIGNSSWDPQKAKAFQSTKTFQPQVVKTKKPAPEELAYVGERAFEIVRFKTEDDARNAFKAFCEMKADRADARKQASKDVPTQRCPTLVESEMSWALRVKVELLQPEWRALAPFSPVREVVRQVRSRMSGSSRQQDTQCSRAEARSSLSSAQGQTKHGQGTPIGRAGTPILAEQLPDQQERDTIFSSSDWEDATVHGDGEDIHEATGSTKARKQKKHRKSQSTE